MKVIVIMPTYNAAQTLEQTYAVPTRYFSEASSVDFKRGVIYGLDTLWTMFKFVLNRLGLVKYDQFRKPLQQVVSSYHWAKIAVTDD